MPNCVIQPVPANQNNCANTLKYQNMYVQEYPLTCPVALNFVYYYTGSSTENRAKTHSKLKGLIFVQVIYVI
jgi:hypothetical protein